MRWLTRSPGSSSVTWVELGHLGRARSPGSSSVTWVELGDDPRRYLLAGPDRTGNLLELVVLDLGEEELVIPAMGLRRSTRVLLRDMGRRMPVNDSWIAATAMALQVPVVAHDDDYVELDGLSVIRV